jgi:creatinine amidohydrolase/Fe(II)-dependent formamide hydrolase-like protein
LGKHGYVIRATTEAIARTLGDALVAPVVSFVPEGNLDPPTGFMRYPGAISVQPDTFKRLLVDIAGSLKVHGFEHIVLISDHGGNTGLIKEVVAELSSKWAASKATIHYVPEYYDYPELAAWVESQGIHQVDEGYHDDVNISAIVMTLDTNAVRMKQRIAAGKFSINGVSLAPAEKTIELGKRAIAFRASATAAAIQRAIRGTK